MKRISDNVYRIKNQIATRSMAPGKSVYGEKRITEAGIEYRIWDPYKSKLSAAIQRGLKSMPIKSGDIVLYLGVAQGTTASHVSDIVGKRGTVFGVEISPKLVQESTEKIKAEGLEEHCKVILGDALDVDLSDADVVVLYLLTSSNELLRPILEKELKRGARVVSHDFEVRGWKPVRVVYSEVLGRTHSIYVYRMPESR